MGDLFEENWDDGWDEALDRRLRAELLADLGPTEDAYATLQTLTPTFVRAARVRRAQTVLASAAMVLAFAGGALFAVSLISGQSSQTSAAGVGDEVAGALDSVTDGHPTTLEVSVTSGDEASSIQGSEVPSSDSEAPVGDGQTTESGVGEAATDSVAATQVQSPPSQGSAAAQTPATQAPTAPATAGTPGPPATTKPASTAKPPATTRSTTAPTTRSTTAPTSPTTARSSSTSLASNERLVQSSCGDMVVRLGGYSYVTLDRTVPDSGYQADVKSSGPNNVEVSFEGSRRHCELWARFDDGEFKTSENGSHEDD